MKSLAVSGIKKKQLAEIRTMANPPPPVKLALESVCELLNESAPDWKTMRGVIVRETFISSIVNFQTENITYDPFITYTHTYILFKSNPC